MHLSAAALVAVLTAALQAAASPAPLGLRTVNLSNGEQTVARSALAARDSFNCKGSSLCSNSQGFKDQCASAYSKIEDTTYSPGGAKSGVCSGHCGIFIQNTPGKTCPVKATGQDLRNAYNEIRKNGCQSCGSDVNGECQVTINYVASC